MPVPWMRPVKPRRRNGDLLLVYHADGLNLMTCSLLLSLHTRPGHSPPAFAPRQHQPVANDASARDPHVIECLARPSQGMGRNCLCLLIFLYSPGKSSPKPAGNSVNYQQNPKPRAWPRKKGSGTKSRNGPAGALHFRCPFFQTGCFSRLVPDPSSRAERLAERGNIVPSYLLSIGRSNCVACGGCVGSRRSIRPWFLS